MFTGIVAAIGRVVEVKRHGDNARLRVHAGELSLDQLKLGDSLCVHGVCLTVVEKFDREFAVDLSPETLATTTLGALAPGSRVHLEPALALSSPLGGHLVTGHVDGVGSVVSRTDQGETYRFRIRAPEIVQRYISRKGSVCVDGVSLTVNTVEGAEFSVQIVPHTVQKTIFGDYTQGQLVNIEVDIVARYIERLLTASKEVR
ncbi:MAG: riboflavin synthase [Gammaproteobacteria bacterium]